MKFIARIFSATLLLSVFAVAQPAPIPQVKVQFANGSSSKTITGQVKGEGTDYVIRAGAGQTMTITLASKSTSLCFNVIPPGEENTAIFIGSTEGNKYEGTLPSSGDYKIRVYLMRAAARRGAAASFTLTVAIAGKPQASGGTDAGKK